MSWYYTRYEGTANDDIKKVNVNLFSKPVITKHLYYSIRFIICPTIPFSNAPLEDYSPETMV